jgi:DNA repair protein RadC
MLSLSTESLLAASDDKIPYLAGSTRTPTSHDMGDVAIATALNVLRARLKDRDVITKPTDVKNYLCLCAATYGDVEVFSVIFLNAVNHVISHDAMFFGSLSQTSVYPREVVCRALSYSAAAVILAHNHPSGRPEPSRADEHLTQMIKSALALIDVKVVDHIIVAGPEALSFAERGLL